GKGVQMKIVEMKRGDVDVEVVGEKMAGEVENGISLGGGEKERIERRTCGGGEGMKRMVCGGVGGGDIGGCEY
ncbi:hypothetical protein, partial [Bacillus pumilus]